MLHANYLLLIIAAAITYGGGSMQQQQQQKDTKNKQLFNDGVSKYTNELYMGGGGGRHRNKTQTTYKQHHDEYPVYDDYNADYDNLPSGSTFRKPFANHQQQQIIETREIVVKQGRLKGLVRVMHPQSGLKNVDQFLGIPYAEAPVDRLRFMPPGELVICTKSNHFGQS